MKLIRPNSASSSASNNKVTVCRAGSGSSLGGTLKPSRRWSSSSLFQPGVALVVQRAPLLQGLSCQASTVTQKKYQRPFAKRRLRDADHALQQSSLGQRRRMNGMAKLLARAGRGLLYKLPDSGAAAHASGDGTDEDDSTDEEDRNHSEDRPFEPLQVWTSPHQGGALRGLAPTLVKELRPNEFGIEEEVVVVKPAPLSAYAKESVFVPPVLAKWLRPHQREGVEFMYQCVMGLKDFAGNGCILADGTCCRS